MNVEDKIVKKCANHPANNKMSTLKWRSHQIRSSWKYPDQTFHFDADTDPTFNFNANPNPPICTDADPYSVPHQSVANLQPLPFEPPRLHCECPRPSKTSILGLLGSWILTSMQIRIRLWSGYESSFSLWCGSGSGFCFQKVMRMRPYPDPRQMVNRTLNFTSILYF